MYFFFSFTVKDQWTWSALLCLASVRMPTDPYIAFVDAKALLGTFQVNISRNVATSGHHVPRETYVPP